MLNKYVNILLCILFNIILSACAVTHEQFVEVENMSITGNYSDALIALEEQSSSLYDLNDDAVLYHLDKGLLSYYAGDFNASNESLSVAEAMIFENFTTSISESVASVLVNDNVITYAGEDYEDIYLNVFKALNYIHLNDYEGAFVEIRRINNKIKTLSTKYSAQIAQASQEYQHYQEMTGSDDIDTSIQLDFIDSAFARYLSMLMYRGSNQLDAAQIDLNYIKTAFATQKQIYPFSLPTQLENDLNIPKDKGRINLISFVGLSPVKEPFSMIYPFLDSPIHISLPVLKQRPTKVSYVTARIFDGETQLSESIQFEMLESIDNIVYDTFEQKQMLIYIKTIVRAVGKYVAAEVTEKQLEDSGSSASIFVKLFMDIYNIASEQADLRIARFFPSIVAIGGISLDPGHYTVHIEYKDANQNTLYIDTHTTELKAGNALNLIDSYFLQ